MARKSQSELMDETRSKAASLLVRKVGAWVALAAFFGGLLIGTIQTGGEDKLFGWFVKLLPFALSSFILLGIALLLVFCTQWVRNKVWYDQNGAGVEMGVIRDRIGTDEERPNDTVAASIQYSGTTIFIGLVVLTYFLAIHG